MSAALEGALSAFFASAAEEFEAAAARGGTVEAERRFGGCMVRLRFADRRLADALLPALAPGEAGVGGSHARIEVWDGAGPASAPWTFSNIGPGGLVRGGEGERLVAVHDTYAGALTLVDRERRRVLHRRRDADGVPWSERAAPLRGALHWALAGVGRHLVHAGAVGDDRGCVLLAGAGGSGKTTVALAALSRGLGYLADDYVVLTIADRPRVSALYRTAKLDAGHLSRFPALAPWVRFPPAAAAAEKAVLDVESLRPGALQTPLPVRAVIVPRIRGARTLRRRIVPAEALLALAPSTMLQLPYEDRAAFGALAELVRGAACFGLDVGDDMGELAEAVEEVLEVAL